MITVSRSELTATGASAIVRPVSAEWDGVTAASRRLEKAAGPSVQQHCRALGELPVGSAVVTPAGDIASDFLVHVVVRSVESPVTEAGVRRGLDAALKRLDEWGIVHAAIAPLGTGAGNLDAEDVAGIMVPAIAAHAGRAGQARIEIVVDSEYEHAVFEAELLRAAREAGTDATS